MKTRFSTVFAKVALIAFALCLSSCNKEEEAPVGGDTASFTGKWECTWIGTPPEGVDLFFKTGDIIIFRSYRTFELVHPNNRIKTGKWWSDFVDTIRLEPLNSQALTFRYFLDNNGYTLELKLDDNGRFLNHTFQRVKI